MVSILLIVKMLNERTTKRVGLTDRIWKFYSQWKTNRKPMWKIIKNDKKKRNVYLTPVINYLKKSIFHDNYIMTPNGNLVA